MVESVIDDEIITKNQQGFSVSWTFFPRVSKEPAGNLLGLVTNFSKLRSKVSRANLVVLSWQAWMRIVLE